MLRRVDWCVATDVSKTPPSIETLPTTCQSTERNIPQDLNFLMLLALWTRGHAVAQWVEALHYKPEGRGLVSLWYHFSFPLTQCFRPHYGPGVYSASNRNEWQEYFLRGKGGRCVGLTALPPSCADCLEIWWPQPPEDLRACTGFALACFTIKTKLLHFYFNFEYVPPRKSRASHLLWSISSLCLQVLSIWEPNNTHNTLCCWCVELVFAGAWG